MTVVESFIGTLIGGLIVLVVAVVTLKRQAADRFKVEAESAQQRRHEEHEERSRTTADEMVQLLFDLTDVVSYATEYRAFDAMGNRRAATTNLGLGHEKYAEALQNVRAFDATKLHRILEPRLQARYRQLSELLTIIGSTAPVAATGRELLDVESYLKWVRYSALQYIGAKNLPSDEAPPDVNRDPGDQTIWEPTVSMPADV